MAIVRLGDGASLAMAEMSEISGRVREALEREARMLESSGFAGLLHQVKEVEAAVGLASELEKSATLADSLALPHSALADLSEQLDGSTVKALLASTAEQMGHSARAMGETLLAGAARNKLVEQFAPLLLARDEYMRTVGPAFDPALLTMAHEAAMSSALDGLAGASARAAQEAISGLTGISEAVQRAFSSEWFAISSRLLEYEDQFARMFRDLHLPTPEELEENHREQVADAVALADFGWPVPLAFSLGDLKEALAVGRTRGTKALDEEMVAVFSEDDGREFESLAATLTLRFTAKKRRRWLRLLKECFRAYRAGLHSAATLVTIPLLERAVADAVGMHNMGRRPTLKAHTWHERMARPNSFFLDSLWHSVDQFLLHVWGNTDFRGPRPPLPNRHRWIHGHDPYLGTQADALRLLVLLDALCLLTTDRRRARFAARRGRQ
jgi:hypothetical protein